MKMIGKGRAGWVAKGDAAAQAKFVAKLLSIAASSLLESILL